MADVLIYTKRYSALSERAKALLRAHGVDYDEVDVTHDDARFTEMAKRAHGALSVPQIFLKGQHLGGCADLERLAEQGQLGRLRESEPAPPYLP